MIHPTPALAAFEARYQSEAFRDLSYEQALAVFATLWAQARALNPDLGADWREDLLPDLAIARALNGLSPQS